MKGPEVSYKHPFHITIHNLFHITIRAFLDTPRAGCYHITRHLKKARNKYGA